MTQPNDAHHVVFGPLTDEASPVVIERARPAKSKSAIPLEGRDPYAITASEFLSKALLTLLDLVRENSEWFIETHDVEALHQLRISIRKTRALASFMYPLARADRSIANANDRLRSLAEPFGEVRDLDVLGMAVDAGEAPVWPPHRTKLRESLKTRRVEAAVESEQRLLSRKWNREMDRLRHAAFDGPWRHAPAAREPARYVVAHELDTWWWKITSRWEGLRTLDPHRRHRVRITAKKLRYLTELTAELFPDVAEERSLATARFKAMQDHLGELQDAVAADEFIRAHGFWTVEPDPFTLTAAMNRAIDVQEELLATPPFWRTPIP